MSEINSNEEFSQDDFEKMLENSLNAKDDFQAGDKIEGTIVLINNESTFLSITGKSEAVISTAELLDDSGNLIYKKGDVLEVYVISAREGEIKTTFTIGKGEITPELLRIAYSSKMPIDGTIIESVKGGFRVSISGHKCFCPFSQIDIKHADDADQYLNKSFSFRIIEYKENGRNILLSRRVLLEEQREQDENALRETLNVGDTVNGPISSIHKFGVFINIGGLEALVPRSEISWGRGDATANLHIGDTAEAKIINLDWDSKKITLSMKQLIEEPWSHIDRYSENQELNGTVVNIIPQGAFVELEPGIEGFTHISKMSVTRQIKKPDDAVTRGDSVSIRILSIDSESRKLSLELITGEADPWQTSSLNGETHTGTVENIKPAGISLRLENGMLGFIPKGELFNVYDMQKSYPAGSQIKVSIKDIDKSRKKLILSEKGAQRQEEEKDYQSFIDKTAQDSGSSLGSLFKDKFEALQNKVKEK